MEDNNEKVSDWLASQVELAESQGAAVDSRQVYQALRQQFPHLVMTPEEVDAELVRLAREDRFAVAFDSSAADLSSEP